MDFILIWTRLSFKLNCVLQNEPFLKVFPFSPPNSGILQQHCFLCISRCNPWKKCLKTHEKHHTCHIFSPGSEISSSCSPYTIQRIISIFRCVSKLKWNFSFLRFIHHWWQWCHEEISNYPTRDEILRITIVKTALAEFAAMQSYELPGRRAKNVGDISHYSYQEQYFAPCCKDTSTVQPTERRTDPLHPKQLHLSGEIAHRTAIPHSFCAPRPVLCISPLLWPFLPEMLVLKPAWD